MIFRRRQQKCWLSIIALLMLVCTCSDDERKEIPTPAKPYLNVKDSLALVDIYKQAHGEGWTLVDWDLENIQTWGGVTAALDTVMNEYRVVGFVMQDGSNGILSDKIGDLVELRSLSLYGKGLYGELPKTIGNLVNLESLVISSTSLSGALPKEIGNLKNIEVMQIYFNEFTEIPKEFGNLPKSGVYMMQHNKFAGEVPETLRFYENSDESSGISGIDLSYNCFTSFPWSFFTDDDDCLVPHLWGNRLSGTIPDEVFKSPKWERWKTQISRQEKGYGYSNYPPEEDEH